MNKRTKETIKVKPNYNSRTFTIRRYANNKIVAKYRTIPFNKYEFEQELLNSERDWKHFLSNSPDYTKVETYYHNL